MEVKIFDVFNYLRKAYFLESIESILKFLFLLILQIKMLWTNILHYFIAFAMTIIFINSFFVIFLCERAECLVAEFT